LNPCLVLVVIRPGDVVTRAAGLLISRLGLWRLGHISLLRSGEPPKTHQWDIMSGLAITLWGIMEDFWIGVLSGLLLGGVLGVFLALMARECICEGYE